MKWPKPSFQGVKGRIGLLVLAFLSLSLAGLVNAAHQKVLLRDVQTLTLHKGRMTTGRRSSPVPQLNCVGGNACGDYEPDVVQCVNTGFDGSDVQWKCQADMPETFRFGELDVYCEGYNHPDDPYVLKGSCGLEYKLFYTNIQQKGASSYSNYGQQWSSKVKKQPLIDTIYFWTWIGVVGLILFFMVKRCFENDNNPHDPPPPYRASGGHGGGSGGSGGGGGGGGGWGSGWGHGRRDNYPPPPSYKPTDTSSSSGGYTPGFWSGLGLGAGAAYLANRNQRRDDLYRSTRNSGWGSSSWSFSGGDYGGSGNYGGGSYGGGGSSFGGSSSSAPTRSASGFGGTKRR
ncbi:hypothetical protein EMPS_03506 [Entomortierella parvispora]|uniref:Store-operated calcium entry-associated regulatory factor n=1 Tax=Entomortierella parvispora TaxID=205924 RepID=A0A9P3LUH0_9FUNG|nr:hypothetical protein EMPS_03506 [Entomortierella parvispora]